MGRYEAAVGEYNEALRLNPADADTHYQLGSVLKTLGRISDAAGQFEAADRLSRK